MDTVVEYDIGCSQRGNSGPIVMAVDERLVFSFDAFRPTPESRWNDAVRAVVKVESYLAFKFGYPNDEALPGHPLYNRGFHGGAVYEVLESSWIAELARQNQVSFPDFNRFASGVRHFLFSFHETTLEVLGDRLDVCLSDDPFSVIVSRMQSWLLNDS